MLISVQRFDGAGRGAAAASRCTGGCDGGGATGCGRALTTGFGFDGPSSALSAFSAFSAFSYLDPLNIPPHLDIPKIPTADFS